MPYIEGLQRTITQGHPTQTKNNKPNNQQMRETINPKHMLGVIFVCISVCVGSAKKCRTGSDIGLPKNDIIDGTHVFHEDIVNFSLTQKSSKHYFGRPKNKHANYPKTDTCICRFYGLLVISIFF